MAGMRRILIMFRKADAGVVRIVNSVILAQKAVAKDEVWLSESAARAIDAHETALVAELKINRA